MEAVPEFRLEIRVKNNRLWRLCLDSGLSRVDLAKAVGIRLDSLYRLLGLRMTPRRKDGAWRKQAVRLAEYFCCCEDDLFPESLGRVKGPNIAKEISENEIAMLCAPMEEERLALPSPDEHVRASEIRERLDAALAALTPRERDIVERRYGLGGRGEQSLRDIGFDYGLGGERLRQIEKRALWKLRHPKYSKPLLDAIDGEM